MSHPAVSRSPSGTNSFLRGRKWEKTLLSHRADENKVEKVGASFDREKMTVKTPRQPCNPP
jgi:hypothetical protein